MIKPVAVQTPFAAGVDQTVEDKGLQDLIPAGTLPARRKFFRPECVESELFPEFAAKPTGSPLAGPLQAHF